MKAKREKPLQLTEWVIVVEDDPTLRMSIVDILDEIGLRPLDFQSAGDALIYLMEMFDGCPLVIVDQGQPGQLSGADFIKLVKKKWPATAAVLTSSYELAPLTLPDSTIHLQNPWLMEDFVMAVATLVNLVTPSTKPK